MSTGTQDVESALIESVCERAETQQCRTGCLVGNLSQEMAALNEDFRVRLEEIFEGWVARYAEADTQAAFPAIRAAWGSIIRAAGGVP